jgi:hypothetical protein
MRILGLLLTVALFISISACGEKSKDIDDIKNAINIVKNAPEAAKKAESTLDKAQKVWEQRRAKGDTIPINFRELQKFLPDELAGYTAKEPKGETMNMRGISYSEASRRYERMSDDGKQEFITMSILDYNAAVSMFTAAAAWWSSGYSLENADGFAKSFDPGIDNCYGYEEYNSKRKEAKITLALAYRYIFTIEGSNLPDTDKLKDILKQVNIEKLARL